MVRGGPLIGREAELAELEATLSSCRLLTVTGAGGCGKSRLALELGEHARASGRERAPFVVELAGVAGAEQLVDALLRTVGARERLGSRPRQVLFDALAHRRLLLILNDCEHLVEEVASLTVQLLAAAPGLQILATSREPLRVADETVYRLGPLSLPEGAGVSAVVRSNAARLFVDHAARCNPAFALTPAVAGAVCQICNALDGLPLALAIAAARLDVLSASEVAEGLARREELSRIDGDQPRHRSLRASLDWSYQLLDYRERALLRRLSRFAGGFTAAAAHAVAAPETSESHARAMLERLQAKGLIVPTLAKGAERWTLLPTVGDYAAEQLLAEDEYEATADRHLAWFLAYAARADTLLAQPGAHELIDEEAANLRLALDLAIERRAPAALEIVASLMRHFVLAEHFEEGRTVAASALAVAGERADPRARAVVQCGAGLFCLLSEDYEGAIANTRGGLDLLDRVEDPAAQSLCLLLSSMVLIQTGVDLREGLRSADRAVELARACGEPLGLAHALVADAVAGTICDRFDAVAPAYEEFLALPTSGHPRLRTWAEQAAAWAEVLIGSPRRALAHTGRALALEGDLPSMTHFQLLGFRIQALARLGRVREALDEGACALARARESGALQAIPAIELALVVAEWMAEDFDAAAGRVPRLLEMPQLHTLTLVHEVLGRIALARGDAREADAQARGLKALAERSGSLRHRALAECISGSAALLSGERDRGRDLLHAALGVHAELGLEREAADVLNELALLAAKGGEAARAARLAAAAATSRERLGCAPLPGEAARLEACRACLSGREDAADWEAAWVEGERLSLADAIAYARRRRGRRDRPPAGWASLTPTELEVAQLAACGLSNPQIATQLFIARGTVKMHLSSVYTKLSVANRTELAASIATRSPDPDQADPSPLINA